MCAPFCSVSKEENSHLFVYCDKVDILWARIVRLWNMNFVGLEILLLF